MKDFELNGQGDLVITNDISYVTDSTELAQSIRVILSTRLREFRLEEDLGISHSSLFGKNVNYEYLKQDITEAILEQEPRIGSISDILLEIKSNRMLLINLKMISVDSEHIEVSLDVR